MQFSAFADITTNSKFTLPVVLVEANMAQLLSSHQSQPVNVSQLLEVRTVSQSVVGSLTHFARFELPHFAGRSGWVTSFVQEV